MRKATRADKARIVEILSASYDTNPSINWIIRNDSRRLERIRELASYSFETGMDREGVYLSSDENGVAICFPQNRKNPLKDLLRELKLVWKAIGIDRVHEALRRQNYVKKMQPPHGRFLNFWFFGVMPGRSGGNAARELKDHIFTMSREMNLPIYVETTLEKNRRVYERYGFRVFHVWEVEGKNIRLYFLKRDPC